MEAKPELVTVEGVGTGVLKEPSPRQPKALVLFNRKKPPRDEAGHPIYGVRVSDGALVCGSKKRRHKDEPEDAPEAFCGHEGRMSNGRCRQHGGRSLKGVGSRTYVHGERSKYAIPSKMVAKYKGYLTDPELTHHRSQIAQVDTLLNELWSDYEEGVGPELWEKCQDVAAKLRIAERAGDVGKSRIYFEELMFIIERGVEHSTQGDRILKYLEARRRHADSEQKRKLSEAMVYSVEEAYAFYTAMGTAIRKHVSSEQEQDAILNEIAAIAGDAGATGGVGSRGGR